MVPVPEEMFGLNTMIVFTRHSAIPSNIFHQCQAEMEKQWNAPHANGDHIYDHVHEMLVVQEVKNLNTTEYSHQHRVISLPPMPRVQTLTLKQFPKFNPTIT